MVLGSGKLVCMGKTKEDLFKVVRTLHFILEENALISYYSSRC